MDREKYKDLVNFCEGNILQKWDKKKLKNLEKESRNFESKFGSLYRKRVNQKSIRVLKEDEIDSVIYMMHNHPTGGHFAKDATFNKINSRFYWKGMYKDIEEYIKNVMLVKEEVIKEDQDF